MLGRKIFLSTFLGSLVGLIIDIKHSQEKNKSIFLCIGALKVRGAYMPS